LLFAQTLKLREMLSGSRFFFDYLDAILRFLNKHIAQGHEFQVRFRWTKNAVAIWDNRVTAHYATFDYLPGNRHAVRVTTHGEIPDLARESTP
jgi:alpha-ketoglutarate-dependent taurine dioxygenase